MSRAQRTIGCALALAIGALGAACAARAPAAATSPTCASASFALPPETPALAAKRGLLQREASIAIAEGAGPLTVIAADMVAEGDRVGAFTPLPEDGCLLAYARGSEGVDDLDLLAFAEDGTPIGSDEATDPRPAILLCAPQVARGYVVARVAQGRGLVAVGVHLVPPETAFRVGRALNARGRPGEPPKEAEVWPGLDAKATLLRRELGGRWEELRRVAIPVEARTPGRITLPIDPGRCLAFLVTPSEETSELDVQLEGDGGRVFARANELGRDRTALVCASVPTSVTVEVRPRIGSGLAAIVVARAVAGSEPDLAGRPERIDAFPTRDLANVRSALGAKLSAAGYGAPVARADGNALVGRRASVELAMKDAGCARVDVVAGTPLAGVLADAWSETGALVGRAEGGAAVTLFTCGPAGKLRVDVEALARPGPFAVEARAEKTDPRLARGGLAGARLLARLAAGGDVARADTLTVLDPVKLSATHTKSLELTLPAGRCVDVAIALGDGASGVDLRLVDVASQSELALSRAAAATVARACAEGGPKLVRLEARVAVGAGEALVATRVVK